MKPEVVYIDVPYREKDEAKSLGAKWDAEERKWFVPKGVELDNFERWMPDEE